jgi:hypothetical protein
MSYIHLAWWAFIAAGTKLHCLIYTYSGMSYIHLAWWAFIAAGTKLHCLIYIKTVSTSAYVCVGASTQIQYAAETPYIPIDPYNFDIWDNILSKPNTTYISIYIFITNY